MPMETWAGIKSGNILKGLMDSTNVQIHSTWSLKYVKEISRLRPQMYLLVQSDGMIVQQQSLTSTQKSVHDHTCTKWHYTRDPAGGQMYECVEIIW